MPVLTINFAGGIDERTQQYLVDPAAALLSCTNAYQASSGALSKPLGMTALTTNYLGGGSQLSGGYTLAPFNSSLALVDGHLINTYSAAASQWVSYDRMPECAVQRYTLPLSGDINTADCVYCNGYLFAIAQIVNQAGTAYDVWACVVDATTMQPLLVTRLTSAVASGLVELAASTTKVWAVYATGAAAIDIKAFDTTAPSSGWTSAVQITDWGGTDYGCDGQIDTLGNERLIVAYKNNSGGASSQTAKTFSAVPALASTQTNTAAATTGGVNVRVDANNIAWIVWDEFAGGVGMRMQGLRNDLTTAYTIATVIAAASMSTASTTRTMLVTGATTGVLLINDSNGMLAHAWTVSAGAVSPTGSDQRWFNLGCGSRPWIVDSRYYIEAGYAGSGSGPIGPTHEVIDFTDWVVFGQTKTARPVANINKGLGNLFAKTKHCAISSTKFAVLDLAQRNATAYGLSLAVLDFASPARWRAVSFAGTDYFAGAAVMYFDGVIARELGFIGRPSKPTITTSGTGISLTTGAKYVCVFEAIDSQGNVEWSAASDVSASTGAVANKTINVACRTLAATAKSKFDGQRDVRIAVYRSDDNGGSGPFYRAGYITNSLASATVTFADVMPTATLITQPQLYINPGTIGTSLNREAPPAALHMFVHQDRLVVLAEDGQSVFYSAPQVAGEVPWFNSAMQFTIPGVGRNVAGWSQDGRMVFATDSELFVVDGDGPPENGGNGTEFSLPRRLPSDVGCIDARSICTTVAGTFFQSRRGIEILTRSFQVEWVGRSIQATLSTYPVVTSASLNTEKGLIYFTLAASEAAQVSGGGAIAVFDLNSGAWSIRDTNASGWQSGCMATVNGKPRFHAMTPDGTVYRENLASDGTAYLLGNAWRTMSFETGWFKLAGLAGKAIIRKVQLLGAKASDHDLTVSVAFNDRASYDQTRTYARADINALTVDGEHLEVVVGNENACRTVRFKVQDATPTGGTVGNGQGATFYGIAIHYDAEPDGTTRRPAGAR